MSDDADFDEFARLLYDFVPIFSVQYPPRMLADKSRVADFDLVVDAICEAEVVVSCEHKSMYSSIRSRRIRLVSC